VTGAKEDGALTPLGMAKEDGTSLGKAAAAFRLPLDVGVIPAIRPCSTSIGFAMSKAIALTAQMLSHDCCR
jgi:hypothetical protein